MCPKAVGFYKKDGKTRPITKRKSKPKFHGQTKESSWKASSIKSVKEKGNGKELNNGGAIGSGGEGEMEPITINGKKIETSDDFDKLTPNQQKDYLHQWYAAHPVPTDFPAPTPAKNYVKAKAILRTLPPDERAHLEPMLEFDPTNKEVVDYILGLKK
jgi:hypothetical protein